MDKKKKKIPTLRFPEFEGEWERKRIGEITDRISDPVNVENEKLYQQIGIRSHGKGLFHKELVTGKSLGNKRVFWVKKDMFIVNIVFAWEQAVAKTTKAELGMIASHRFPMYQPVNEVLYLEFILDFFLTRRGKYLLEMASPGGAGRNKTLGQKEFERLVINIPGYREQQKIADFLTAVDDKINRLTRKKTLLEQYKKGVMQKIFSQEIRFPEFEGEWKKQRLGDFLVEYKERVPSNTNLPVLTSSRSGLFLQKDYFSNRELQNEGEYGVVPKGYFTYRHMSDDSTFMFNINNIIEKGAISKEYPVFTTKGLNSYFLQQKLNHGIEFKKFAIAQKLGGTRVRLYFKKLIEFKLNLPSLPEQQKIADFLTGIDKKIELVNTQLEKTKKWKKALLQQMFV